MMRLGRGTAIALAAAAIGGAAVVLGRGDDSGAAPRPGLVASGAFESMRWPTTGRARLVRAADGRLTLALAGFSTHPAPEVDVYLVPGGAPGGDIAGGIKLGRLARYTGESRYAVPTSFEPRAGTAVVVWCTACSVPHGKAALHASLDA